MATCSDIKESELKLTADDVKQAEPLKLLIPTKYPVGIEIYQDAGKCNGSVVPNPTFAIANQEVNIYDCADLTTVIATGTPTQSTIKNGVLLKFIIDTSVAPLNAVGKYVAVFQWTRDAIEQYVEPVYFNVVDLSCPL